MTPRERRQAERILKSHDEQYQQEIGYIYSLVHRIIERKKDTYYQSPHWDREPTAEMKSAEQDYQMECEDAQNECNVIGRELIKVLFGSNNDLNWRT